MEKEFKQTKNLQQTNLSIYMENSLELGAVPKARHNQKGQQ